MTMGLVLAMVRSSAISTSCQMSASHENALRLMLCCLPLSSVNTRSSSTSVGSSFWFIADVSSTNTRIESLFLTSMSFT